MLACSAGAETLRIATWSGDFSRKGPGLLLKEMVKDGFVPGQDLLVAARADILVLTDFDFDAGLVALGTLRDLLADQGQVYDHVFAKRPNTGIPTDLDLDGDGRRGGPRDAQGYGWFSGQSGQAVLSKWPVSMAADHSDLLWRDLPGQIMPPNDPGAEIQRLSSSAHWMLNIALPSGPLTLLTLGATPPVFDGPEDRNGRRNHDEVRLWDLALSGEIGPPVPDPLVLLGKVNTDPDRGDGRPEAVQSLLAHPRLQDPLPGQATANWPQTGPLRVSYVLPGATLRVEDAGVIRPEEGPHQLVWVDITLP